jgi:integrase
MRGSIRERGKGNWEIQVYSLGQDGKTHRQYETVHAKKKSDVQPRLNQLLSDMDKGIYSPPGKLTVGELLNSWLTSYAKTNCGPMTFEGYQNIAQHHLVPALGNIKLKELHHQAIEKYYAAACETLSPRTVAKHHRLLSQSMRWAVRKGYLGRNPCEFADPPAWKGKKMHTLTAAELGHLLEVAEGSQYYPVIYMAVSTGLRQAELLGLRWRDLDLDMMSLSVSQVLYKRRGICEFKEPKTAHSRRRVSMTPKLALFLKGYYADRESMYLHLGKGKLNPDWLVFSRADGNPLDPSMLSHEFHQVVTRAGLENFRFHDLRHTFASLALLKGAKPKVISEALGHSSVAFTMDVYSHIMENMQSDAMALLDEVLPVGVFQKSNGKLTATVDIKNLPIE